MSTPAPVVEHELQNAASADPSLQQSLRYTVVIKPVEEDEDPGWYYAHVPALEITTHGKGVEGALAMAKDAIECWIGGLRDTGEAIPREREVIVAQVEVRTDALQAA